MWRVLLLAVLLSVAGTTADTSPFCQYHHSCGVVQREWHDIFRFGWEVVPQTVGVASEPPETVPTSGQCRSCYWNGYLTEFPYIEFFQYYIQWYSDDFPQDYHGTGSLGCVETTLEHSQEAFLTVSHSTTACGDWPATYTNAAGEAYTQFRRLAWGQSPFAGLAMQTPAAAAVGKYPKYNGCKPAPEDTAGDSKTRVSNFAAVATADRKLVDLAPALNTVYESRCDDPGHGNGQFACKEQRNAAMGVRTGLDVYPPVQIWMARTDGGVPVDIVGNGRNKGYGTRSTSRAFYFAGTGPTSTASSWDPLKCRVYNNNQGGGRPFGAEIANDFVHSSAELYCVPDSACVSSTTHGICQRYANAQFFEHVTDGVYLDRPLPIRQYSSADGQFLCQSERTGVMCAQNMTTGFDARTATACPDPQAFDICSGRGHCMVKEGGVGLRCACSFGWYGDERYINMYASRFWCLQQESQKFSSDSWSDPDGEIARYAANHQCVYWRGRSWLGLTNDTRFRGDDPPPPNWDVSTVDPGGAVVAAPGPPYRCADHRTVQPGVNNFIAPGYADKWRILYGGLHCAQCPDCDPLGSDGCVTVVPALGSTTAQYACECKSSATEPGQNCPSNGCDFEQAHPFSTKFNAQVVRNKCRCRNGFYGETCNQTIVPQTASQVVRRDGICDWDKGHAFTEPQFNELPSASEYAAIILANNAPVTVKDVMNSNVWDNTTNQICQCKPGWGGPAGTCSDPVCTTPGYCVHGACGPTANASCPTYPSAVYDGPYPASTCEETVKVLHRCEAYPESACGDGYASDLARCRANAATVTLVNRTLVAFCDPAPVCHCNATWGIPPGDDRCVLPLCPNARNGQECGGLQVAPGWEAKYENQVVCNYAAGNRECECYKAVDKQFLPNSPEFANNGVYTQTTGTNDLCNIPVKSRCQEDGDVTVCKNRGVVPGGSCVPSSCGPGTDWDKCSAQNLAKDPPRCVCELPYAGPFCGESLCNVVTQGSAAMPCSANNAMVTPTGQCIRLAGNDPVWEYDAGTGWRSVTASPAAKYECQCEVVGGVAYAGDYCDIPVPGCTTPPAVLGTFDPSSIFGKKYHDTKRLDLCSGAGTCVFDQNSPAFDTCICDNGHVGAQCQTQVCPVTCAPHQGSCEETSPGIYACVCLPVYAGVDCSTNLCAQTGGSVLSPTSCECGANGVSYPDPQGYSPTPYASFVGCRKRCPAPTSGPTQGLECGGRNSAGVDRCFTVVAANSTDPVACSCLATGTNPFTKQTSVTFVTHPSGYCEPKCVHCMQLGNGNCDATACPQTDGVCQYTGARCNIPRCGANGAWNGTQCVCNPPWLFDVTENPTCNPSGPTRCGSDPPWRDAPELSHQTTAGTCNCSGPYKVDYLTTSPTHRLCVSNCPPNSSPNPTPGGSPECVCNDGLGGALCNQQLCTHGLLYNQTTETCDCTHYPQWAGPNCDQDQCVGGTAKLPPEVGCDCYPAYTGDLCQQDKCGFYGQPSTSIPSAATDCVCDSGWTGDTCATNRCGVEIPPIHDASAPHGFTCVCGPAGDFDAMAGTCINMECGNHGVPKPNLAGTAMNCRCDVGYTGVECDTVVCSGDTPIYVPPSTAGGVGTCEKNCSAVACPTHASCQDWVQDKKIMQMNATNIQEYATWFHLAVLPMLAQYPSGSDYVKLVEVTDELGVSGTHCGCSDPRYFPLFLGADNPHGPDAFPQGGFFGCWQHCYNMSGTLDPETLGATPTRDVVVRSFYQFLDPDTCQCNQTFLSLHGEVANQSNCDPAGPSNPLGPVGPPHTPTRIANQTLQPNGTITPGGVPTQPARQPYNPPNATPTANSSVHPLPPVPGTALANNTDSGGHPLVPPPPDGPTDLGGSTSPLGIGEWLGIGGGVLALGLGVTAGVLYFKHSGKK